MEQYLRQYAEPETVIAESLPAGGSWGQLVVIPVCDEPTGILRPLPAAPGRSLMIIVINEPESAARHVSAANGAFAREMKNRFRQAWKAPGHSGTALYEDADSPRDLLLVDRFSDGFKFPPKRGVGLARKIGADLAACLIHRQRVRSPWIHCSDADVRLPPRYFSASAALGDGDVPDTAALVYPFHHGNGGSDHGDRITQVTRLYEFSLRYYVAGLAHAASPYAFHTIGSTIAVNALHYAKVRGFPRREAGEDFYLLNKLAKVGSVRQLDSGTECEPIGIAARRSDRVPFGTGAAVGKIMKFDDPQRQFLLYHPAVFSLLGDWLRSFQPLWDSRECSPGSVLLSKRHRVLVGGLEEMGVGLALRHALKQSSSPAQFRRQMHTWFDAFRTLKLIHFLRDRQWPSISLDKLLNSQDIDHLMEHEPGLAGLYSTLRHQLYMPADSSAGIINRPNEKSGNG